MFYRYYLYVNEIWRTGKVVSDTVEDAAKFIKRLHQIESKENTIIIFDENDENEENICE